MKVKNILDKDKNLQFSTKIILLILANDLRSKSLTYIDNLDIIIIRALEKRDGKVLAGFIVPGLGLFHPYFFTKSF